MVKSVRHTGIVIKDMENNLKIFRDIFGFTSILDNEEHGCFISKALGLKDCRVRTVKLSAPKGEGMIELLYYYNPISSDNKSSINSTGITHISLTVTEIDNVCHKLAKAGCRVISRPAVSEDGFIKLAFVESPDNFFLELVELQDQGSLHQRGLI